MKGRIVIGSADTDFFLLFSHVLESGGYPVSLATTVDEVSTSTGDGDVKAFLLDGQADRFPAVQACLSIKENVTLCQVPTVAIIAGQANPRHLELLAAGVDEIFVRPFAPAKLLEFLCRRLSLHK